MDVAIQTETWPLERPFVISRGSKTEAVVIVVSLSVGPHVGRGECVPYARYGETVASVLSQINTLRVRIENDGLQRDVLQTLLPPGAARNAVDCALWDLEAKMSNTPVWERAEVAQPHAVRTAFTITLDSPEAMGDMALKARHTHSMFKIKLGTGEDDKMRLQQIRRNAPTSNIIVDANEGWTPETLESMLAVCKEFNVLAVEQPLPAGHDAMLEQIAHPILVCADESVHTSIDIPTIVKRYDVVNIKLDKAGGLTEALILKHAAQEAGLQIMVGCMVSTSLSMAPAFLLAQDAQFVDLDGAFLLAKDRPHGLVYRDDQVLPPTTQLWG